MTINLPATGDEARGTGFDSELSLQAASATTWRVLAPLIWTGTNEPPDTFTVPVGFVTDLTTVPRFLHWLILPYGAYTRAAVLHDWLLAGLAGSGSRTRQVAVGSDNQPITSRDTDGIFRRVMEDLGVPWAKRWVMWAAVRVAALFNSRRSYGRDFHKDALRVFGIALLAAPVILPGAIGVLISLGLTRLVTGIQRLVT